MRNRALILCGVLACSSSGCDDGESGDPTPSMDFSVELDAGPQDASQWDAGDGEVVVDPRRDLGPPDDMGVSACLARGGALTVSYESAPLADAVDLRADLDPDGDGRPAIVITHQTEAEVRLALHDGTSAEVLGEARFVGAEGVALMPRPWPRSGLLKPLPNDVYGVWAWGAGGHAIHAVRASNFEVSSPIALAGPAESVRFVEVGSRALAFVELVDRGCALIDLNSGAELMAQGRCDLQPGWDANGDNVPEIVRSGGDGTTLLDGNSFEVVAQVPQRLVVGPGPVDARGMGPEIVAVEQAEAGWVLHHLSPIDLTGPEPIGISGDFVRAEIHAFGDEQRVLLEEERLSLRYLRIIEPDAMGRRRAELGSYRQLWWQVGPDANADGAPEIHLVGGSTEDGSNTDVTYIELDDGAAAYTIEAERSARFLPAFGGTDTGSAPQDMDGCEGREVVALRQGALGGSGTRPTRVHIYDADGRVIWRSEPFTTAAHALAVANLDGEGPFELLELRAEDGEARLRIHRAAQ